MKNPFDITGRKAIVTGGGRGIGYALASALLDAGAQVAILDVSESITEIATGMPGTAYGVRADLLSREGRKAAFQEAVERLGGLDILVNNAGIQVKNDFLSYPEDAWDRILELNLTCAFQLTQMAGRLMKEQGGGKIINMSSMNAYFGGTNCPAYAASKAGIAQMTKAAANELSAFGVNVNAMAPGFIETELTKHITQETAVYEYKRSRIPKGRWGVPEDLTGTLLYLASSASDYVCGVLIPVDGGYLCK